MTISYELAKELKDAGFSNLKHSICEQANTYCFEDACTPTLSELIEACGPAYFFLNATKTGGQPNTWFASATNDDAWNAEGIGATPEEAVARLWLALNKKQ